jgi:tetratricopeptide (TPR) repeat protein
MINQFLTIFMILGGATVGMNSTVADSVAIAQDAQPDSNPIDQCYQLSGQAAIDACDRALAINPEDAILWTNRGVILHEQLGQTAEALDSHAQAIALAPDYSLALYNYCVVLMALERYEEAIASCAQALQGDGRWGQANPAKTWMNQGVALRRLRRYNEALEACDRAIELAPDYALAWNNRGVVLLSLGRVREAEASFVRALELDPDNDLAKRNLSIVQQQQP